MKRRVFLFALLCIFGYQANVLVKTKYGHSIGLQENEVAEGDRAFFVYSVIPSFVRVVKKRGYILNKPADASTRCKDGASFTWGIKVFNGNPVHHVTSMCNKYDISSYFSRLPKSFLVYEGVERKVFGYLLAQAMISNHYCSVSTQGSWAGLKDYLGKITSAKRGDPQVFMNEAVTSYVWASKQAYRLATLFLNERKISPRTAHTVGNLLVKARNSYIARSVNALISARRAFLSQKKTTRQSWNVFFGSIARAFTNPEKFESKGFIRFKMQTVKWIQSTYIPRARGYGATVPVPMRVGPSMISIFLTWTEGAHRWTITMINSYPLTCVSFFFLLVLYEYRKKITLLYRGVVVWKQERDLKEEELQKKLLQERKRQSRQSDREDQKAKQEQLQRQQEEKEFIPLLKKSLERRKQSAEQLDISEVERAKLDELASSGLQSVEEARVVQKHLGAWVNSVLQPAKDAANKLAKEKQEKDALVAFRLEIQEVRDRIKLLNEVPRQKILSCFEKLLEAANDDIRNDMLRRAERHFEKLSYFVQQHSL